MASALGAAAQKLDRSCHCGCLGARLSIRLQNPRAAVDLLRVGRHGLTHAQALRATRAGIHLFGYHIHSNPRMT